MNIHYKKVEKKSFEIFAEEHNLTLNISEYIDDYLGIMKIVQFEEFIVGGDHNIRGESNSTNDAIDNYCKKISLKEVYNSLTKNYSKREILYKIPILFRTKDYSEYDEE